MGRIAPKALASTVLAPMAPHLTKVAGFFIAWCICLSSGCTKGLLERFPIYKNALKANDLSMSLIGKVYQLFRDRLQGRTDMAKGQKRSNKEVRKPKKDKEAAVPPAGMTKGIVASMGTPKKKG